ncbi:MAG: hypothetical protein LUC06_07760 [Oscillospiraceae bacterium]|nr:hypothetical protein [Oscillospiraceae bacterium]
MVFSDRQLVGDCASPSPRGSFAAVAVPSHRFDRIYPAKGKYFHLKFIIFHRNNQPGTGILQKKAKKTFPQIASASWTLGRMNL